MSDLSTVECVISQCFNSAGYLVMMKEFLRNKHTYNDFHNKKNMNVL